MMLYRQLCPRPSHSNLVAPMREQVLIVISTVLVAFLIVWAFLDWALP